MAGDAATSAEPDSDSSWSTSSTLSGGIRTPSCSSLSFSVPATPQATSERRAISANAISSFFNSTTATPSGGARLSNVSSPSESQSGGQQHEPFTMTAAGPSNAEDIRPSIERRSESIFSEAVRNLTSRTVPPSLSFTPPPNDNPTKSQERAKSTGPASPSSDDNMSTLGDRMQELQLFTPEPSLNLTSLRHAIRDISIDNGGVSSRSTPAVELTPPRTSESTALGRRRRSSRSNIETYTVESEEPPNDRFYESAFQNALSTTRAYMSLLAKTLGSSSLHHGVDSTMRQLFEQAERLSQFQCPSSRTVGFVGDSGVGKSSLLNSLLDRRDLARASNKGAACTCVATEYHYHDSPNYVTEVELFTMDELFDQITEHVRSYRHFHLHQDPSDRQETEDFEEKANLARDSFRAMFRRHRVDASVLLTPPEPRVLSTLKAWAREAAPLSMNRREVWSTPAECSAALTRLTSDDDSEGTSADQAPIWPYIKKIKVHLNAHILSKGLILVDLPGLRDLNSARRHITERYLLRCDEIFAVCNEGRATTDEGVKKIFELAMNARLTNVGIICTKSDDVKPDEAKKDWKGQKAVTIQKMMDAVATAAREVDNIRQELCELDEIEEDGEIELTEEEKDEQVRLNRRLRKAEDCLDDWSFQMNLRNDDVSRRLHSQYHDKLPPPHGNLSVFCVSNPLYWAYRHTALSKALPRIQLSGIAQVRAHCMGIVSESQYRAATDYMRGDIPALLGEVALWVQSGSGSTSAERKRAMREAVDALERRLRRELTGNAAEVNEVEALFKREFRDRIYQRHQHRIVAWSTAAADACHEWHGWAHQTYSAFCRKYGTYCTKAAGYHNWNEEIVQTMSADLRVPWRIFRVYLKRENEKLTDHITDVMNDCLEFLDEELPELPDSSSDWATTLNETLSSRKRLLVVDIEALYEAFKKDLDTLGTDALSNIRTSFIGKAMEDAYRASIYESGTGSDARRKAHIGRAVRRETLFPDLLKEFRKDFNTLATKLQRNIQRVVQAHLQHIRATLDLVRNENVALESESDPEFRARVAKGVAAVRRAMESIWEDLDVAEEEEEEEEEEDGDGDDER